MSSSSSYSTTGDKRGKGSTKKRGSEAASDMMSFDEKRSKKKKGAMAVARETLSQYENDSKSSR